MAPIDDIPPTTGTAVRIDAQLFDLHSNDSHASVAHSKLLSVELSGVRVAGMLVCCGDMELARRAA